MAPELARKALAELIGSALLAATVVGSGIAAETLSPDDTGLQLLENSLVTGAVLVALILALGPVSAAFDPWDATGAGCAGAGCDTRSCAGEIGRQHLRRPKRCP